MMALCPPQSFASRPTLTGTLTMPHTTHSPTRLQWSEPCSPCGKNLHLHHWQGHRKGACHQSPQQLRLPKGDCRPELAPYIPPNPPPTWAGNTQGGCDPPVYPTLVGINTSDPHPLGHPAPAFCPTWSPFPSYPCIQIGLPCFVTITHWWRPLDWGQNVCALDLYLSPKNDWLELFPERLCMMLPSHSEVFKMNQTSR